MNAGLAEVTGTAVLNDVYWWLPAAAGEWPCHLR